MFTGSFNGLLYIVYMLEASRKLMSNREEETKVEQLIDLLNIDVDKIDYLYEKMGLAVCQTDVN